MEEQRSVIKSGNSLSISLPANWCYLNNVFKGTKLLLEIGETSLSIRPQERVVKETCIDKQQTEVKEQEPTKIVFSVIDRVRKALEDERSY